MIHLVAIQTSPGVWTITSSDLVDKWFPALSPARQVEIMQKWMDMIKKKDSGREEGDNATK